MSWFQLSGKKFSADGRGVLVTGCSSGIGQAIALHLARQGFTVFATVRRPADADRLRLHNLPDLIPIEPFDLTQREQIPGLVQFVGAELARRGQPGLYGLVNNAGAGSIAPIELMDLDKFHIELQTRLLGPLALVQSFLPMVRARHGRLVWIVTPALIPTPFVASIHACDFAANCLSRTLALELKPWRIPGIMIRCGGIATAASAKNNKELEASLSTWTPVQSGLYIQALERLKQEFGQFDRKRSAPEEVARVTYQALAAKKPASKYQVGHMSHVAALLEALPQSTADQILAMRG